MPTRPRKPGARHRNPLETTRDRLHEANRQQQRERPGGTDGDHSKGRRTLAQAGRGGDSPDSQKEEDGMNTMSGNFSIGRFGGVEVRINWSLIVVFALIVWSLTDGVFPSQNPGLSHGA